MQNTTIIPQVPLAILALDQLDLAAPSANWPYRRLEKSIRNQHDACQRASHHGQAAEEFSMLQHALQVPHPPIAPGEIPGAREPLKARSLFRAIADHSLRLLRRLGEFAAAGGALS